MIEKIDKRFYAILVAILAIILTLSMNIIFKGHFHNLYQSNTHIALSVFLSIIVLFSTIYVVFKTIKPDNTPKK